MNTSSVDLRDSDMREQTDSNSRARLWVAILAGVVGPEVFIVQPAVVEGFVKYLGFDAVAAGYAASVEVWGIALSSILLPLVAKRVNWRTVIVLSILLMVAGNAASAFTPAHDAFLVLRFLVGVGAGGLISLSFAAVGLTANPDRNFGYMIMWVMIYGALGLWLVPSAFALGGMKLLLLFFAAFPLLVLPFVRFLPRGGETAPHSDANAIELPTLAKASALLAMLLYFVAQGIVWAYLFLIGTDDGLGEQQVANALTLSQFMGVLGAWAFGVCGARIGRSRALTLSVLGGSLCLLLLTAHTTFAMFALVVCIYNFFWNVAQPALLSAMAVFDRRGRMVLAATAMQMIGLATGPALAAWVIASGSYSKVIGSGVALFVASWFLIYLPVRRHALMMRQASANADAAPVTETPHA
jgi:predicted MFS family arabinose efflux permease